MKFSFGMAHFHMVGIVCFLLKYFSIVALCFREVP